MKQFAFKIVAKFFVVGLRKAAILDFLSFLEKPSALTAFFWDSRVLWLFLFIYRLQTGING